MSRWSKTLFLALVVVLIVASPTPSIAGRPGMPGYFLPGDPIESTSPNSHAAGDLGLDIKMTGTAPPISVNTGMLIGAFPLAGAAFPDNGAGVAARAAELLCVVANAPALPGNTEMTCSPASSGAVSDMQHLSVDLGVQQGLTNHLAGPNCGFTAAGTPGVQVAKCDDDAGGTNGFFIVLPAQPPNGLGAIAPRFFLVPFGLGPNALGASLFKTTAADDHAGFKLARTDGGAADPDLLDSVLLRLIPANGTHSFSLRDTNDVVIPGSPFTITTPQILPPGKTADQFLHETLCQLFAGRGIGASLHPPTDTAVWLDTTHVSGGYSVELFHPASLGAIHIAPVAGSTLATQLSARPTGPGGATPALSEWGMMVLIVLLVLTGAWMIRRRQRLQSV